ncbi:MAG TPA: hypothetical protein DCG19_11155 [Cryomorphaceae bacterium]|nr:hypothetical protein [Owenweeksia sp.]HAD97955.1 hypothetical protein [Cryomorphaceae bacterium]HBF18474.1 hypothetical protein [Cryomorphaceae bacterium]|tara:strand:- start:298 stop:516 length:219 start_codon:yes stop_codon:yes gene_type:complete
MKNARPVFRITHDYRLLVLAILACYTIMTFDYLLIKQGNTVAWLKMIGGGLSIFYFVWINARTFFKSKSAKD